MIKIIYVLEEVPSGLPNISFPAFEVIANNHTYTFVEMVMEMGSGIAVIPFIAILANIAVAKAFGKYFPTFDFIFHYPLYYC